MPKTDDAVANPPKGGDQTQASTNDDNINSALHQAPHVVTIAAHGQVGVLSRFPNAADAETFAAAARRDRPAFVDIKVVKENDIDNGLPALVAEVEAAEAEPTAPAPAPTAKSSK